MMRDRGRGLTQNRDLPGQYQDVSQITAVQVTPRPKPRAFPRTNPSYVSVQRRDGNPPAFRHVDTMAASAFNHGYQLRGQPGGERTSSGRYYPSLSGAQTLQTSHSYLGSESARRSGDVRVDDQDNIDSDSSLSSSSSDTSANGLRRQYTLDSKPSRRQPHHADQSEVIAESRLGVAGLVGISAATSRHLGGPKSSSEHKSPDSSPVINHGPVRRSQRHARHPKSEPEIPPPPRTGTIPNGVVRPSTARRNSEPDYVNVPSKPESQLSDLQEGMAVSVRSGVHAEQSQKSVGAVRDPVNPEEHPRGGDGTLRIRDHVTPAADYVNCQDIVVTSSNVTSSQSIIDGETLCCYFDKFLTLDVFSSVCLFVCLFVNMITSERVNTG